MSRVDMKHIKVKKQSFGGIYRGVVENNNDPDKLGRVQVRIVGIHTDDKSDKNGIPTDMLPWAEPCFGLMEGSVSGYGSFSIPVNGCHIFIFFEGENWECPRYFATAPGKPETKPDVSKGFSDPSGSFPSKFKESDLNRLSRGENISETVVQYKKENKETGILSANGLSWDEPDPYYSAQYPYNSVIATRSGIVIEIDNTPNNVRLHAYHPSGSFVEIDKDGNMIIKNGSDRFDICKGDSYRVCNSETLSVNGDKSERIESDRSTEILADDNTAITGNKSDTIGMNCDCTVGGDVNQSIVGQWNVTTNADINLSTVGNMTLSAGGVLTLIGAKLDFNPEQPVPSSVTIDGEPTVISQSETRLRWSEMLEENFVKIPMPTGYAPGDYYPYSIYPGGDLTQINLTTSVSGIIDQIRSSTTNPKYSDPPALSGISGTPSTGTGHIFLQAPNPSGTYVSYTGSTGLLDINNLDYDTNITTNFKLWDLTSAGRSEGSPTWPVISQDCRRGGLVYSGVSGTTILNNLTYLCVDVLEPINTMFPGVVVTTGFRHSSWKGNNTDTDHPWGSAADISWSGITEREYFDRAKSIYNEFQGKVGEVVLCYSNYDNMWIHVSCLRQDTNGGSYPALNIAPPLTYLGRGFIGGYELRKFVSRVGAGIFLLDKYTA